MPSTVAAPVWVAKVLGVRSFLQTSAAGGIGKNFRTGALALVRDHLTACGRDPLANVPVEERRPAFLDMSDPYPGALRAKAKAAARKAKVPLQEGVLAVTHGPSYETAAEVKVLQKAGAHAVCMSGLCESVFARYLELPMLFLLVITNRAAGMTKKPPSHDDVLRQSRAARAKLSRILKALLPTLP